MVTFKSLPCRLLSSLVFCAAVSATPSLFIGLKGPASAHNMAELSVVTTLTNKGHETLHLLRDPSTVLTNMPTHSFNITNVNNGATPDFMGYVVQYSPRQALASNESDVFSVLKPGASINITHSLGQAYNFTKAGAGTYNVFPHITFQAFNVTSGSVFTVQAQSASQTVNIINPFSIVNLNAIKKHQKRTTFVGCSDEHQGNLGNVVNSGETYARDTYHFLTQSGSSESARYNAWFGAFSQDNYNVVLQHFQAIDAADFGEFTYDCGTYKYIYLCDLFWQTNLIGSDSQAGLLIKLGSQFPSIAGTSDLPLFEDKSACRSLASNTPLLAITNAASHEYFAENDPAI
ncbi:hypothetical protein BDZ97DRAFT_1908695 [Flammula alnicola]|nr:hypothetical protein BDZ97DRAFT_1908695 [Flammula alnicola]